MSQAIMQFAPVFPEIFVLAMVSLILVIDAAVDDSKRYLAYVLSLATLAGAAVLTLHGFSSMPALALHGLFIDDPLSDVLKLFLYLTVAVVLVYSRDYLRLRGLYKGEFFALTLFALLGMMVMVSASHFLTLYLGLELLALSLYAMVALQRDSRVATEAAMKYFVLGALASGMLLYGMSMVYGVTGSLGWATWPLRFRMAPTCTFRWCSASSSSSPASRSNSAWYRSICGCRTCMKARRRR